MSTASELEIIAHDQRGLPKADRDLLREAAKEMHAAEHEAHKLRNYALELEQQLTAQTDRMRELQARLDALLNPATAPQRLDWYGHCYCLRIQGGTMPSWSVILKYELGGKVCKSW